MEYMLTVCP